MAISAPHFYCLKELRRRGELPQGGALLEIGQANWYGDLDPVGNIYSSKEYVKKIEAHVSDISFEIVRQLYNNLFGTNRTAAIDLTGPGAMKHDLNEPIFLTGGTDLKQAKFPTVINHGTAE